MGLLPLPHKAVEFINQLLNFAAGVAQRTVQTKCSLDRTLGHDQDEQAAGDYEPTAEKNPVVRDLLEENE